MGYKSPIHQLDLPDFKSDDPGGDDLLVKVVAPSAKQSGDLNAGRRTIAEADGTEREETSVEYMRRAMSYLAPKIRFWNLEDEDGTPVALPRDISGVLDEQVNHLMEQDENIVLAIYHEWRMVGMPAKEDTEEGKDSETPSTDGPSASQPNAEWPPADLRELEAQIPM
jgi:hypothetical protein